MIATCPYCGKPLAKETGKNKYFCQGEGCPVVFVRYPTNPFKRKVFFASTVKEVIIRRIEEATAREISCASLALAS
jgi:NAD-dependent DNA ligase